MHQDDIQFINIERIKEKGPDMPKKVLTITMNPALDINSEVNEVHPNQKLRCEKPQYDPGGGGINVARVLTRLGVEVDAQYFAGGVPGEFLKKLLNEEDMNDYPNEIEGNTRENVSIIDKKSGEQYRYVFPGPELKKNDWNKILELAKNDISPYEFVVASGSLPPGVPTDFYSRLGKIVLDQGKQYVLDTSGNFLMEGIQHGATFIKPNQEEFDELKTRMGTAEDDDLIQKLFELGIEHIIHTQGKEGTVLHKKNGSKRFDPPELEVNSSIGAGDSFVGGLIAGLVNDNSTEDAVCYGIAAAASTLKSPGTALCDLSDVQSISEELCGSQVLQ